MSGATEHPQGLDEALTAATRSMADEVFEQTGGDKFRSGQPLIGDPSVETSKPAPEPTSEEKPPAEEASTETTSVPKKKIAGKYDTLEEAERGILEAGNTISRLARENDELKAKQPPAPPPEAAPETEDPFAEVEKWGVPKEPLQKAMQHVVSQTLKGMMEQANVQTQARQEADRRIIEKYPEYKDHFNDLTGWLSQHPDIERQVLTVEQSATNPDQFYIAREYAWALFERDSARTKEAEMVGKAAERKRDVAEKRVSAAVPDTARSHTRDVPPKTDDGWTLEEQERLKKLRGEGHESPLWRATIGKSLEKQYPDMFGVAP